MELQYLQEFLVLARVKNYGEAAAELNMNQSGLSRHIQALERELGALLIDRSSRQIELTSFGEFYLPSAERICADCEQSEKLVRLYLEQESNTFRAGAPKYFQYYGITDSMVGFATKYPDYHVDIFEASEPELDRLFQSGAIHLMATYHRPGAVTDFGFIRHGGGNMVALVPDGHSLEACQFVTLPMLEEEDLLLPTKESRMTAMIREAFEEQGMEPKVVYEGSSSSIFDFIKAGMGIAILPEHMAEWDRAAGLKMLPLEPAISYEFGLGFYKKAKLSRGERAFVKYYRELDS